MKEKNILKYCELCKKLLPVWNKNIDSLQNTVSYEQNPWDFEMNGDDSKHWICVNCHNVLATEI